MIDALLISFAVINFVYAGRVQLVEYLGEYPSDLITRLITMATTAILVFAGVFALTVAL